MPAFGAGANEEALFVRDAGDAMRLLFRVGVSAGVDDASRRLRDGDRAARALEAGISCLTQTEPEYVLY